MVTGKSNPANPYSTGEHPTLDGMESGFVVSKSGSEDLGRVRSPRSSGSHWVIGAASLIGLAAFFYPFFLPVVAPVVDGERLARAGEAPIVLAAVTGCCLLAILAELGGAGAGRAGAGGTAKTVALLASLVAIDATLRLAPTVLGASPIFFLIMLVGVTFGAGFGFTMGALTLLVSAFLTGGLGPWLPYQMLGAGWVGMSAGWLPSHGTQRGRLVALAAFGAVWGLLFGALLNLSSWPFTAPGLSVDAGLYPSPGISAAETLQRYGRFYLVTSLPYDLLRAIGNAMLVLLLGGPVLRLLERFRDRFTWQEVPERAVRFGSSSRSRPGSPDCRATP